MVQKDAWHWIGESDIETLDFPKHAFILISIPPLLKKSNRYSQYMILVRSMLMALSVMEKKLSSIERHLIKIDESRLIYETFNRRPEFRRTLR